MALPSARVPNQRRGVDPCDQVQRVEELLRAAGEVIALDQLGVTLIPASAPEARGRSERMFGTLQGRLPQELRSAGISTIAAANRYLREVFLPVHNARFRVPSAEPGTAFIAYVGRDLADILCF